MQGLLVDVNVQGFLRYLGDLLESAGLMPILIAQHLQLKTFRDIGLHPDLDDRSVWSTCQQDGWVLFTENRNHEGPDSLQAVIDELWRVGDLPVITVSKKSRLYHDRDYGQRVAEDLAGLLVDIKDLKFRDQPRVYIPLPRMAPR